jgi:hypothetical protein
MASRTGGALFVLEEKPPMFHVSFVAESEVHVSPIGELPRERRVRRFAGGG